MEYLLLVLVFVLGLAWNPVYRVVRRRFRTRFFKGPRQVGPVYNTRIDAITDDGMERYKLHRAHWSPSRRAAMRGTPLYEKAAAVLGWED